MPVTRLSLLEEEIEWRKCKADVKYFAENYCYIRVPGTPSHLIELRAPQIEVLDIWAKGDNSISLKARQIGWSTIVCIYVMWVCMFQKESSVVLLSRRQVEARALVEKCRFMYNRFPGWMADRVPLTNKSVDSCKFANDSYLESMPSTNEPARGSSNTLVVLDELAFYRNAEEAWAAIEPSIDVGGQCIALSTANGAGNFFHKFYRDAEKGVNNFVALFYSWRALTTRDDAWYAGKAQALPPWQLAQEYPTTAMEAFVVSGSPAFDVDSLLSIKPLEYRQGWLMEGAVGVEFKEALHGSVHILREPEPGEMYVIGADVAAGSANGDYSCAIVLNAFTGEQVARWHGHINVDLYADELHRLGTYYNMALLAPESNGVGEELCRSLSQTLRYPNLFSHPRHRGSEMLVGWRTTTSTKLVLVLGLVEALRDQNISPTHSATINECIAYRQAKNGGFEGDPHDDEVMALGIANQMLFHVRPERFRQREPVGSGNGFTVNSVLKDMNRQSPRRRGRIGS